MAMRPRASDIAELGAGRLTPKVMKIMKMREVDNAPVSIGNAKHEKREKTEKVHRSVPKSRGA